MMASSTKRKTQEAIQAKLRSQQTELESEAEVATLIPTGDLRLSLTRNSPSAKLLDELRLQRISEILHVLSYWRGSPTTSFSRDVFLVDKPDMASKRFRCFVDLSAWLLRILEVDADFSSESSNPNAMSSSILEACKSLNVNVSGLNAVKLVLAPSTEIIALLHDLASLALKSLNPETPKPSFESDMADDDEEAEEEDSEAQFRTIPAYDWDDEEIMEDDAAMNSESTSRNPVTAAMADKIRGAEEWRLEADRLAPFFSKPAAERTGWADRIRKLESCRSELQREVEFITDKLTKINDELGRTSAKISSREKYIAVNYRDKVERYRTALAEFNAAKSTYESQNSAIDEQAKRLADLTEEFERLKRRVEEKGSGVADRAVINNMKAARKRMKEEIGMFNIRTAIAELKRHELSEKLEQVALDERVGEIETAGILTVPKRS